MRPEDFFQLAPNMRTAYIELCIYAMSKSATYWPERTKKKVKAIRRRNDFLELARNTYIHLVVGLRANTIYKYDVKKRKAYSSTYEKEVYICSKDTVIYIDI